MTLTTLQIKRRFYAHLSNGKRVELAEIPVNDSVGTKFDLSLFASYFDVINYSEGDSIRFYVLSSDNTAIPLGAFATVDDAEKEFNQFCKEWEE